MQCHTFNNAFDALEDEPQEAMTLKLKFQFMEAIHNQITLNGWTQQEAAEYLHVTKLRISHLFQRKVTLFSLDTLIKMLALLGDQVQVSVHLT